MFTIYLAIVLLVICLIVLVAWITRMVIFTIPTFYGAVFIPSADDKLATMLELAKAQKGEKIMDIGCGDGKIIFELAKQGLEVEGVEMNPLLVRKCNRRAIKLDLQNLVTIHHENFWDMDFSKYDLIFLYGITNIMKKLEAKLQAELKPGARIISNHFQFPDWKAEEEKNDVRVYRR